MVDAILIASATITELIVTGAALYTAYKMRDLVAITNYLADLMEQRMGLRGDTFGE